MALLSVQDARLGFGAGWLLDGAALSIESGERVGLVGRNGTGKSSLLNVLAGRIDLDGGEVVRQSGARVGCLAQEQDFSPDAQVFSAIAQGLPTAKVVAEYDLALQAAQGSPHDAQASDRLQHAHDAMEVAHAWSTTHRVSSLIERMGLDEHAIVARLSGGQQRRVALARALAAEPDLLLLDEPTNHLDVASIEWLEGLLRDMSCATLFVTHDRMFLDRVATRIVELDRGRLRSYPGSFAQYRLAKTQQLEVEQVDRAKADKLLAQEEVWIRKGVEARRTRSVARIARLEALRSERAARRQSQGRASMRVDASDASGKRVIELEGVGVTLGGRHLVRDLDVIVQRGDKLALVGDNGTGKTTLLKLMLGTLAPDTGHVKRGTNLQIAYFDQLRAVLDGEKSVRETIAPGSDWIEISGRRQHVMSYLGDFLFAPERANSPVRSLSGGERNRLLLARLFARPANLLVLDEPTNDLDIETLELLEDLLVDFDGTILLVSHDRAFIDRVATQVLLSEGEGRWSEYVGGWSDAQVAKQRADVAIAAAAQSASPSKSSGRDARSSKAKLAYLEQRELDALPKRISALEAEQAALSSRLADPAIYSDAKVDVPALSAKLQALGRELDEAVKRWSELEDKASALRSS